MEQSLDAADESMYDFGDGMKQESDGGGAVDLGDQFEFDVPDPPADFEENAKNKNKKSKDKSLAK